MKLQRIHVGLWFSRNGDIFRTELNNEENPERYLSTTGKMFYKVLPEMSANGYLFLSDRNIPYPGRGSSIIKRGEDEREVYGKYIHQMIVFTYGDKDGRKYSSVGIRNVIDHIDIDHGNNSVENLQLVSYGINLFRAYYKTKMKNYKDIDNCETRFKNYYNNLDAVDRKILDIEIELDLQGKY